MVAQTSTGINVGEKLCHSPDFNDAKTIERMLKCIAKSLAKRAPHRVARRLRQSGVLRDNIFINHWQAHSGMVFDNGEIVRW